MNKYLKWILIVLIVYNVFQYLDWKNRLPKTVVSLIEQNGCEGYEPYGSAIPVGFFFRTETKQTVYLHREADDSFITLEIDYIDPSPPFLPKFNKSTYSINDEDIRSNFSHCFRVQ